MAYAVSSDYIEYTNITSSDHYGADDELRWTAFIARSTSIINTYTGRVFEADSDTVGSSDVYMSRKFDANADVSGSFLFLDKDLCEVGVVTNGDAVAVSDTEYVTDPRNSAPYYTLKLLGSSAKSWTYLTDPENAITVTGIWAYSKTAPADIKHATLRLSKWLEDQRKSDGELDRPLLAGEGSVILPMRIPEDVKSILAPYCRMVIK